MKHTSVSHRLGSNVWCPPGAGGGIEWQVAMAVSGVCYRGVQWAALQHTLSEVAMLNIHLHVPIYCHLLRQFKATRSI